MIYLAVTPHQPSLWTHIQLLLWEYARFWSLHHTVAFLNTKSHIFKIHFPLPLLPGLLSLFFVTHVQVVPMCSKQVRPWQHKRCMFLWLDKWPIPFISHLTKCLEWKLCELSIRAGAGAGKHWRMWFIRCLNGLNGSECGTWHSAPARYQHSTRNHLYIYFYCTDTSPRISAIALDIERKTWLSKNYIM